MRFARQFSLATIATNHVGTNSLKRHAIAAVMALMAVVGTSGIASAGLCLPYHGTAQKEINTFDQAWSHWNSSAGGVIPAGSGLIASIKSSSPYVTYTTTSLVSSIQTQLLNVSKTLNTGTINSAGDRSWEISALGGYAVSIQYIGTWTSTPWKNNQRTVSTNATVRFAFNDSWDFVKNDQYSLWQNISREYLPSVIAGCGKPFRITGLWEIQTSTSAVQSR